MDTKKWKVFLKEDKQKTFEGKTYGMTVQEVLDMLEHYGDRTWIFFDTETTGFDPGDTDQITEIAGIAVDPSNWMEEPQILGQFNEKIKLNPEIQKRLNVPSSPERASWEKKYNQKGRSTPQDVLKLTRYGEKDRKYVDEQQALNDFMEFVNSFDDPIIVAQNAAFDMKFLSNRWKRNLKRYPVLDTLPLIQLHLIPLLKHISKGDFEPHDERIQNRAIKILKGLEKRGYRGRIRHSAKLGDVATSYGISPEGWHNALADVKMTIDVFRSIYKTLQFGKNINIRPEHEKAVASQRSLQQWIKRKKR